VGGVLRTNVPLTFGVDAALEAAAATTATAST
jgi:hypothetical protein